MSVASNSSFTCQITPSSGINVTTDIRLECFGGRNDSLFLPEWSVTGATDLGNSAINGTFKLPQGTFSSYYYYHSAHSYLTSILFLNQGNYTLNVTRVVQLPGVNGMLNVSETSIVNFLVSAINVTLSSEVRQGIQDLAMGSTNTTALQNAISQISNSNMTTEQKQEVKREVRNTAIALLNATFTNITTSTNGTNNSTDVERQKTEALKSSSAAINIMRAMVTVSDKVEKEDAVAVVNVAQQSNCFFFCFLFPDAVRRHIN